MKLGVFTTLFSNLPLAQALEYFKSLGIEMVEIGCAGYPGHAHANPEELLGDKGKLAVFQKTVADAGMEISAFSCHGNPLHPNQEIAAAFDQGMRQTVLLAEACGLHQINTFSGCPGDWEGAKYPNWVTCPWPDDFLEILNWQWNEKLIPYWKEFVAFAKAHGVTKIGLELHPGFCVYHTESLLRLREAVGEEIGANFDPSHLVWQGIDPVTAIRSLGDAIFHFHAKDTKIDPANTARTGVLDTKSYGDVLHRSWVFRSVGYGGDAAYWKDIISALRVIGYDYAVSIEHEDSLMSQNEGLRKAVALLKDVLISEPTGAAWWF
ncbi:MAG: sugar phosphate isomerase/epimerase [Oscillospiraceae bacterium]|jgi:sugar phosphate isomerase/epimerase|nr:sugar phosphate isomerase/epimerase [Oscillospiraceae bacterium]